jgi:hypothetical protein
MKKIFPLLFLFVVSISLAQTAAKEKVRYVKITQTNCIKKKGYRLKLKEIVSDSRCPEGVNCVWAGEIKVVVSVYQDKKFAEDDTLTISAKHLQENKEWFSKYLPSNKSNIKSIVVLPYPKEGVPKNLKDYYLQIGYL